MNQIDIFGQNAEVFIGAEDLKERLKAALDEYVSAKERITLIRTRTGITLWKDVVWISGSSVGTSRTCWVRISVSGGGSPNRGGEEGHSDHTGCLDERPCDQTRVRHLAEFLSSLQENRRPDSDGVPGGGRDKVYLTFFGDKSKQLLRSNLSMFEPTLKSFFLKRHVPHRYF